MLSYTSGFKVRDAAFNLFFALTDKTKWWVDDQHLNDELMINMVDHLKRQPKEQWESLGKAFQQMLYLLTHTVPEKIRNIVEITGKQ